MSRRSETPFAMTFFHRFPLVIQVERQRTCHSLALFQQRTAGNDETESRHTLNTLVGTADHKINSQLRHVNGYSAKTAHGINDEHFTMSFDHFGNFLQRIQDTGRRFTMNHRNMCHFRMFIQILINLLRIYLLSFFKLHYGAVDPIIIGDYSHTLAISTVGCNQQMIFRANHCAQYRFHTEASASLHQYRSIFLRTA